MLVLSRKEGESILIPDLNIEIKVVKLNGGRVRLGLAAPEDQTILRGELCSWHSDEDANVSADELPAGVKSIGQDQPYSVVS